MGHQGIRWFPRILPLGREQGSIQFRPGERELSDLKRPLGTLLVGDARETMPKLGRLLQESRVPMAVAVGDAVSRETLLAKIPVDVRIVDMMTLRKSIESTEYPSKRVFKARN